MSGIHQTPSLVAANAQARAQGTAQGQALQSPLVRRSQYLAEALKANQASGQNIQSGGELAARLLAQALLQGKSNLTDEAMTASASNADLANRQRLAAMVGGKIEGSPVEVPNSGGLNPLTALRGLLSPRASQPQAQTAPVAQPAPQQSPTPQSTGQAPAFSADLAGAPDAPVPQAQAAPAATPAPNPFNIPANVQAQLLAGLQSGDPERVAEATQLIETYKLNALEPAQYSDISVNGVPYIRDQRGNARPVFEGGLPQETQTQDVFNPTGTRAGTFAQRDPSGKLTLLEKPPEGFEAVGGRLQPVAGGPQDPSAGGNQITNERNLRQEYQRATDEYRSARAGFQKVEAASRGDSGADDIALIFGYMKTLDPTSTVREGEFATAQNTGSIPQQVQAAYNKALSGERLHPEQRRMFAESARSQFQTYEQAYQDRTGEYISMAEQYGLNPTNVVGTQRGENRPTPRARPAQPAGTGANGNVLRQRFTPEQARAELRRRRGG